MKALLVLAVALLSIPILYYSDNQCNVASVKFEREVFKNISFTDLVNLLKLRDSITIITVSNNMPENTVVKEILIYRFLNDSVDALVTIGRYSEENSYRDFVEVECRSGDSVSILISEIRFYKLVGVLNDTYLDETMLYKSIQRRSLIRDLGISLPEILYGPLTTSSRETSIVARNEPGIQNNESLSQTLVEESRRSDLGFLRNVFISFIISLTIAIASYVILRRI